ncbi:hypothetical protein, partial [Sodalis-like endosymbiont of Proechinophthirus fluctus]|uniref:hypothetical protein n=1 Tax=Sodalis-like endosymbiont of Proechinophthirus fluctus TaxID=1462730 RepID=UPI003F750AC8
MNAWRQCCSVSSSPTIFIYLALLLEYPSALGYLILLCAASPMIASQLVRHLLLLGGLLDPATHYH